MSCPDCFKGSIHDHTPLGTESTLYNYKTYIATPPSTSTAPASLSTILFVCDAFGPSLTNNKLLADTFAARTGCRVLVPDIMPGGGISTAVMGLMDKVSDPVAWYNLPGQLARVWTVMRLAGYFIPFLMRANPSKCMPAVLEYARNVKKDLPEGGKLGICGYCWGGYQSTALCAEPAVAGGTTRLIDAQFCAHPSALSVPTMIVDAVTKFKVPYSLAHADLDFGLPTKKIEETEAILRQKVGGGNGEQGCNYEVRVYKDCHHGFAARAKPGDNVEAKGAEDACDQAVDWFNKWL